MNGNITPLADIINIARRYQAIVVVDDCHATGIVGESGRGTEEEFGKLTFYDKIYVVK